MDRQHLSRFVRNKIVYRTLGLPTLVVYVVLLGACLVVFPHALNNGSAGSAAKVSLGLFTGSDPSSISELSACRPFLGLSSGNVCAGVSWLAWIVHIMSWLLIPALVAFLVADKVAAIRLAQLHDVRAGYREVIATTRPELSQDEQQELLNKIMTVHEEG